MAEQSVSFPEDDAVDDLYQPLKLAPQDRKVTIGEDTFELREEIEADLFEITISKVTERSWLRVFTEDALPVLFTDLDEHAIRRQLDSREVRPVTVGKTLSPIVEKLSKMLEERGKTVQKKRRQLPK